MKQIYLGGRFIRQAVASTGAVAAGLKQGAGLFETMRVRHACVYLFNRHLQRLFASCPVVGLKPPARQGLIAAVKELIRRNGLQDGALRLALFDDGGKTKVCISERPFPVGTSSGEVPVFSAVLYDRQQAGLSDIPCVKTIHRDFYRRVGLFAAKQKADEAFFLNARLELVEGSRTNIFCVRQGDVLTPSLESGCLSGITRARVLELLAGMKVRCYETAIGPEWLYGAEEIFVTNALIGVAAVTRYNGRPVGPDCRGPLVSHLAKVYQNDVENACRIG
ncbi:MAG: aminotransferase class IV [Candidatus Omnitrophota bacterium]|jgi:branched-subunit amino acid aminotransferase/4-amino-4-deoxychorismate lyase